MKKILTLQEWCEKENSDEIFENFLEERLINLRINQAINKLLDYWFQNLTENYKLLDNVTLNNRKENLKLQFQECVNRLDMVLKHNAMIKKVPILLTDKRYKQKIREQKHKSFYIIVFKDKKMLAKIRISDHLELTDIDRIFLQTVRENPLNFLFIDISQIANGYKEMIPFVQKKLQSVKTYYIYLKNFNLEILMMNVIDFLMQVSFILTNPLSKIEVVSFKTQ